MSRWLSLSTFPAHWSSCPPALVPITNSCLQKDHTVGKYTGLGGCLWVTRSISMLPVLPLCATPFTWYWLKAVISGCLTPTESLVSKLSYSFKPSPNVKADCIHGWFIHIYSHWHRNKFYALATPSIWLLYFNSNNIFPSLAFHSLVLLSIREEKEKAKTDVWLNK